MTENPPTATAKTCASSSIRFSFHCLRSDAPSPSHGELASVSYPLTGTLPQSRAWCETSAVRKPKSSLLSRKGNLMLTEMFPVRFLITLTVAALCLSPGRFRPAIRIFRKLEKRCDSSGFRDSRPTANG